MQVTVERPQPCEVVMTVEVDDQQLEQATDRAYREYAKYVKVPGFRPGKAPRQMLTQMLDAESVARRARELVIPIAYRAALQQSKLIPYDQGTVDEAHEEEGKPFTFKATVPLRPEVELGSVDDLKATREVRAITDEDVNAELAKLTLSQARLEPTDEPAQDEDVVFADMDMSVGGEPLGETRAGTFSIGENMTEIDAVLRGASGGDTRECDVEYPAEFADENLAGKTVHFKFRVNHVLAKRVPELTDEWVSENTDAGTVEEALSRTRTSLELQMANAAESDVRGQLLQQVVARSQIHFPTQLVDREVADDLRTLNQNLIERDRTLEQYIQSINLSLPELQDQMAITATQRVSNGLVMGKIAQTYNLQVTPDEMNAEIIRLAESTGVKAKDIRRRIKDEGQMPNLEERLLQDKLFDFLKERATIEETNAAQGSE